MAWTSDDFDIVMAEVRSPSTTVTSGADCSPPPRRLDYTLALPDVVPGQVTARTAALLATHRWWSGDDDRSPRAGLHFDVTG